MHEKTAGVGAGLLGVLGGTTLSKLIQSGALHPVGAGALGLVGANVAGVALGRRRQSFLQGAKRLLKDRGNPHRNAGLANLIPGGTTFRAFRHASARSAVKRGLLKGLGVGVGGLGAVAALKAMKAHREKKRHDLASTSEAPAPAAE